MGERAVGRTCCYTISVFSSKFVIIPRADGLKWRGELKCFLISEEFNNVGNIKGRGSAKHFSRALRRTLNDTGRTAGWTDGWMDD